MRLVNASEMRAIDQFAMQKIGLTSRVLMENAGLKVLFTLERVFQGLRGKRFTVVCGKGNNGGDGLVMARHLLNNGVSVNVFVVAHEQDLTGDCAFQAEVMKNCGYDCAFMTSREDLDKLRVTLEFSDVAVDALYGTGFSGNVDGYAAEVVRIFNDCRGHRVAIDVPSGVCSTTGRVSDPHVNADLTITLGLPKLGLYLPPGLDAAGDVWLADIGIPPRALEVVAPRAYLVDQRLVQTLLPTRPEQSHKGTFGHVMILAGSHEYQGAGVLATYGALRSGAGLISLGLPEDVANGMTCEVLPDVITRRFPAKDGGFALDAEQVRAFVGQYRAVVAGPGWGRQQGRRTSLLALIQNWAGGLVLDADALNLLESMTELRGHGSDLVLTPHLGEMSRLTGKSIAVLKDDLPGAARELAERAQAVVLLKSAVTVIAIPDGRIFLLSRPNSGLARGGAGDLLAGLVGGFMAQGIPGWQAAIVGAFLHSEAGRIARDELGADAMTISEVASLIPRAFRQLRGEVSPPTQQV
ncbi:MAG TPA: NAD(P)H-hydrate dehydratase [Candidatus Ozemobacteraceae bacterium]|nr:NAD(P)H-hydrate dehydratase [Candidatus Ozemobacteraceae bacterium]